MIKNLNVICGGGKKSGHEVISSSDLCFALKYNKYNINTIFPDICTHCIVFFQSRCPSPDQKFKKINRLFYEPLHADDIRWNFEKFLVDWAGRPIARYSETVNPLDMIPHIDYLLDYFLRPVPY